MAGWGKEPALQGLDLLREAIARDPNYGRALIGAVWCTSQLITGGWTENPETHRREALDLVRRAVKAAPDDPEVLVRAAGTLDLVGEDIGTSLAMLDHALVLNPSNAFGWFWSGFLTLLAGSLRQVPTYVTTAYFLASCYAHMERLDDARGILDHLRSIGSPLMPPPGPGLRDPTQREFWVSGLRRAAGEAG